MTAGRLSAPFTLARPAMHTTVRGKRKDLPQTPEEQETGLGFMTLLKVPDDRESASMRNARIAIGSLLRRPSSTTRLPVLTCNSAAICAIGARFSAASVSTNTSATADFPRCSTVMCAFPFPITCTIPAASTCTTDTSDDQATGLRRREWTDYAIGKLPDSRHQHTLPDRVQPPGLVHRELDSCERGRRLHRDKHIVKVLVPGLNRPRVTSPTARRRIVPRASAGIRTAPENGDSASAGLNGAGSAWCEARGPHRHDTNNI